MVSAMREALKMVFSMAMELIYTEVAMNSRAFGLMAQK